MWRWQNHGSYVKRYSNFIPDVSVVGGSGTYLKATEQYLSLIKQFQWKLSNSWWNTLKSSQNRRSLWCLASSAGRLHYQCGRHRQKNGQQWCVCHFHWNRQWPKGKVYGAVCHVGQLWHQWKSGGRDKCQLSGCTSFEGAGLPLTDFQSYLSDLQQNVPFISAHALKENTGIRLWWRRSGSTAEKLWRKLLYNDLFDTKHRLQAFYSYE